MSTEDLEAIRIEKQGIKRFMLKSNNKSFLEIKLIDIGSYWIIEYHFRL